jgi:1,4-alpha-glucan branching enzyme
VTTINTTPIPPRDKRIWWRDSVTYQIYIRSFADANGDGKGDVAGIISRLPYLKKLGVDAIWITPWYPSPQKDHGYDVADFKLPNQAQILVSSTPITDGLLPTDTTVWFTLK